MGKVINVDMAHFNIAKTPDVLTTSGIGSCVAVCLYDPKRKIGGLAHVMLPYNRDRDEAQCGKYADTAIDALIQLMVQNGADRNGLSAVIAGGSTMLASARQATITIGKDNLESVKDMLADRHIRIFAENTGGSLGRAVTFHTETGVIEVTVLTKPPVRIAMR